ncbi:MAG: hypothetical protein F9K30_16125 [Dechloromonas sp.]|nr:MAG: hypothetical protein F9K30_16125 [Dechloromonas sp.]
MTDLTRSFSRTAGKHFVTLSCVQQLPEDSGEKILVFSGFVVDVSGEWFYVTAGHILRDIHTAISSGSSFDVWRLDDQTACNRFNGMAVPFAFDVKEWLVLRDEISGLDYAAVHLSNFYRRQLEAGGVTAIARSAWSDHATEHDYWVLVGIPSETVAYDGKTTITARVVVSPLTPAEAPAFAGEKAQNQFYAKPADGSEYFFNDPDGMSGGPVFGLKKQREKWVYGVIGVQSAWYPTSRTLAVCPFSSFGFALEEVVAEVSAIQSQSREASDMA